MSEKTTEQAAEEIRCALREHLWLIGQVNKQRREPDDDFVDYQTITEAHESFDILLNTITTLQQEIERLNQQLFNYEQDYEEAYAGFKVEELHQENERLRALVPDWVSATYLPKQSGNYLVQSQLWGGGKIIKVTYFDASKSKWQTQYPVTHWQPLPAPPLTPEP